MASGDGRTRIRVGVDTGGTFTDFVAVGDGAVRTHKVLSTPAAPEAAILEGLADLGLDGPGFELCHGSTVATNAVLEGRGGRVAFVTNRGFADLLTIGRQARSSLYELSAPPHEPPVPPELCFETGGRIGADGTVLDTLTSEDLDALAAAIGARTPDAIAVALLHAYQDDRFERAIAERLADRFDVSTSGEVLAEIGEYERAVATWLNAYVAPRMRRYLQRLQAGVDAPVSVMQSDGLTLRAANASKRGVRLLLSGPAGGLVGAQATARLAGHDRLLTLDVGGTSTDVALIDGDLRITREGHIGPFPVAVPMVDMRTVGAGGGSIAGVDAQGLLHVGPRSAGATPGPACYGQGGDLPTVTDAMVLAGRLPDGARLGRSGPRLSRALAAAAMAPVADRLERTVAAAADAVIRLANERMAGALREVSVQRGHDPRTFTLCPFGGAGGLHACELAALLGMRTVLLPAHAGVLSALGMAFSTSGREATRSILEPLAGLDPRAITQRWRELEQGVRSELESEQVSVTQVQRTVDLRYAGQSFALSLPWSDPASCQERFHDVHRARFGHALDAPVELVSIRLRAAGEAPPLTLDGADAPKLWRSGPLTRSNAWDGNPVRGPGTLLDRTGACWIGTGWQARRDEHGQLRLEQLE